MVGKNIGGLASRRRRRMWIGLITTLVVLLAVGTGVAVTLKPWSEEFRHGGLTIAEPPVPVRPFPRSRPHPTTRPYRARRAWRRRWPRWCRTRIWAVSPVR